MGELKSKSGYIKKKSPTLLVGWQKRWVVLEEKMLKYYKEEVEVPLGINATDKHSCLKKASQRLPLTLKFFVMTNVDDVPKGKRLTIDAGGVDKWIIS